MRLLLRIARLGVEITGYLMAVAFWLVALIYLGLTLLLAALPHNSHERPSPDGRAVLISWVSDVGAMGPAYVFYTARSAGSGAQPSTQLKIVGIPRELNIEAGWRADGAAEVKDVPLSELRQVVRRGDQAPALRVVFKDQAP